jgi:hypothetical protein
MENFTHFFSKLELVIEKVISKGEKLISSSDCNMNFFKREQTERAETLFLMHTSIKTADYPQRISNTVYLLHVWKRCYT